MPTTQINIISEQTIPNILFIKQFEHVTDRFIFVSTQRMNQNGQLQAIINVCGLNSSICQTLTVSEESLTNVESKLEALQLNRNDLYIVNITGGTKIMSIGVYDFFSRRNSHIYYIPIGTNQFKRIFPPANEQTEALTYKVTLPEYLTGYGISITNRPHINTLVQPQVVTQKLMAAPFHITAQPIKDLRNYITTANATGTPVTQLVLSGLPPSLSRLTVLLQYLGFKPHTPNTLNLKEIDYLLGQWLEEYVYIKIKNMFNLSDAFVGKSVEIKRQDTPNEFDIIATYNNTIYVIECKTGLTKPIFDQTAYKLNALKREFGLFVKSALVCLNKFTDTNRRLDSFGIKLFDGTITKNKTLFENELKNLIK